MVNKTGDGSTSVASAQGGSNYCAIGHEKAANWGSHLRRAETSVTCRITGTADSFVFHDLWQGTRGDIGWVEVGTSYCDPGSWFRTWVQARYDPALNPSYKEYDIPGTPPIPGVNVVFKIQNSSGSIWKVLINGSTKGSFDMLAGGSTANSADVGLEVTPNATTSTVPQVKNRVLRRRKTSSTTYTSWNGQEPGQVESPLVGCYSSDTVWRQALNSSPSGCV